MKVSVVANGFQEDYTLNLINALANQDVEVDFIGSNIYNRHIIDRRIAFHQVRKEDREGNNPFQKGYWVIQYFVWYVGYLIRTHKKVIHLQWLRFNFIDGVFFPLLARLLGHKVVYTAHDVIPHGIDNKRVRILFRLIYHAQNKIVVHTNYIKERIQGEFGIEPGKISVVKHGVYIVPEDLTMDFANSRRAMSLGDDEFVLLFFGIISEYKGLDLLASSLQLFRKSTGKKIRLIVAGRVQDTYEREMSRLKEKELGDEVIYYLRFIKNEEVSMLFGAADITVLPYREASQSGVMFMSYAYGVPVVAPNLGGFPDDVEEGKTGFLFETNNPVSLYETINKAISHFKPNNISIREEIIKFTSEKYKWEESASALAKIYDHEK